MRALKVPWLLQCSFVQAWLWMCNWLLVLLCVQGKDVASVRQYAESIIVNLVLREPVMLMHKHVLPSLLTYHAK